MRPLMRIRSALVLLLVASAALARDRDKVTVRTLLRSEHPGQKTHSLHVTGQVACVLRFDQPVNPARTRMLGWEGRFEPLLAGGNKVVVEPLHDLASDERIPLVVTLVDGTEVSFLLAPPSHEEMITDQQVNVFKDRESYNAVLSFLYDALGRERVLKEENERFKREENSVDHAFAALLVNGQADKTPFRKRRTVVLKNEDMDLKVEIFAGPGKAAVVVHLTNTYNHEPWRFSEARLTSERASPKERPFALRMDRAELVHGQSGTIAVVADQRAFESKEGLVNLTLEIFREDGLPQVTVMLDHTLIRK